MTPEKERDGFEAAFSANDNWHRGREYFHLNEKGEYAHPATRILWEGWIRRSNYFTESTP